MEAHRSYLSFYLASKSTRSARASYKLSVCSQVAGGTDESFASSGVRLFEAKGVQIDGWGRDKFMNAAMLTDRYVCCSQPFIRPLAFDPPAGAVLSWPCWQQHSFSMMMTLRFSPCFCSLASRHRILRPNPTSFLLSYQLPPFLRPPNALAPTPPLLLLLLILLPLPPTHPFPSSPLTPHPSPLTPHPPLLTSHPSPPTHSEFGFQLEDTVIFKVEITVYGDLEAASFPAVSVVNNRYH